MYAAGSTGDSMQLREVLAAATAPYFSMLKAWLWQGRIHDPFQEFMVQQQVGTGLLAEPRAVREALATSRWLRCEAWPGAGTCTPACMA